MKQYNTRTVLFLIGIAISLGFAISLTFFFNSNMIALLKDREIDQIERLNAQIVDTVERDASHLAVSLRDIATHGEPYRFLEMRNPYDQVKFLNLNPMTLLRLNYAAIVGNNGFLSERFFDYREKIELDDVPNSASLREVTMWLARETQSAYDTIPPGRDVLEVIERTQISGFANAGNVLYYFTAVPIMTPYNDKPSNGTFIYGRVVSNEEVAILTLSSEEQRTGETNIDISLMETKSLAESGIGTPRYSEDGRTIRLQSIIPAIDDSIIVLSTEQRRLMYEGSVAMVRALSVLVFLFACALSFILLATMEFWLLRPISTLAHKVSHIDYNLPHTDMPTFRGRELNVLSNAIRELLYRVEEHKVYIEEQNERLSEQNQMLDRLANYDPHTNLPNKNMFRNLLREKVPAAKNRGNILGVVYLNIVNFRLINDARGRSTGDIVIIAIANRLNSTFGMLENNAIACFGRENFALILEAKSRDEIVLAAYTLISLFNEPFTIDAHEIPVTVSVGITIAPFDGETFDELDACANIAMNNARETGDTSSFLFFDHKQLETVISKYNRIADIKRGLERGEFKVVFQPKLNTDTNMITSSEALVRWHAPTGIIPPSVFIPDACETGLIVPLSWEILRLSFESNIRFARELGLDFSVGVNVPNNVLLHSDFIPVLSDLLGQTGMDPGCLNVELTEDVLVNDMKKCNTRMHALQRMGVQISIDDFGTGYASLQYLSKMPFNWMKIDKTFVDGLPDKPEEMAIIAASVGIARGLGMKVVLEGVETTRQMEIITEENYCDQIQGYVVSKPLAEEDFLKFVADWNDRSQDRYHSLFYNDYGF
ncbi:EAL domain-containing protein [Synergistaceae bacterium OttesenSCG-928-I11]|nr:EAL domain-containing protein [Synergistaceae bacterium OttesenSCG-928-I11]